MTTALPLDFLYGTVRWTVVGIDPDSAEDVGEEPDADQINGKVTFTPIFSAVKYIGTAEDPEPKTVLPKPQTYDIVNGRLRGKSGNTFVRLVANDSPGTSPQGWQYKVDYQLDDGYTFGTFFFSLEGGDDVYLTLQQPEEATPGVFYVTGPSGTISVGTVTTGAAGTAANVVNVGTPTAAVLDFTIPEGDAGTGGGGVTDHGALTGLSDDDHPQYHNNARGDARYVGLTDSRLTDSRTPTAHTHPATEVSDSTTVGRSVLTAATTTAARTAIGAGTSSLALGSTSSTAAAGDHNHDTRYYTETESDTQITAAKARANHTGTQSLDTTTDSATRLALTAAERTKLSGVATGATANATDAQLRDRATHTGTQVAATLSDLTEVVQDIVGSLIIAGVNTTVSYDDAAGTFTINSSAGGGGTDAEIVRDVIGTALVAGSGIQITVNDVGDTITIASTAVLPTRQIISGTGLSGGGDLSADRTLAVAYGTTAGTAAQGNDARLSDARTPLTHTHTASQISDSTTVGRSVVTAVDAAAARTAIGAGTSSLALGTTGTTAKAGDYAPPVASETVSGTVELATAAETTTGTDSTRAVHPAGLKVELDKKSATTHIHDDRYYTEGETDLKLAERAPNVHTHVATDISNSTTVGRSVVTAVDAAAARTAIGAGTSSLALGTTSTTAKAGDYAPPASSETVVGIVELATAAETTTGTDSTRAVHPAGLKVELDKKAPTTHTHTASQVSDSTATGRSILTAADAAAVRTASGAGRVDSTDASVLNVVKVTAAAHAALVSGGTTVATTLYVLVG